MGNLAALLDLTLGTLKDKIQGRPKIAPLLTVTAGLMCCGHLIGQSVLSSVHIQYMSPFWQKLAYIRWLIYKCVCFVCLIVFFLGGGGGN